MDKFIKYYWNRTWLLNLFITLMVLWGVIDSISGKYSVYWLYLTLIIFVLFTAEVRNYTRKKYVEEKKLFRQGLME